jgi:hypothetical protein
MKLMLFATSASSLLTAQSKPLFASMIYCEMDRNVLSKRGNFVSTQMCNLMRLIFGHSVTLPLPEFAGAADV